jgi:molybdopterin/thiamine biosynthesis adenylyltransferase
MLDIEDPEGDVTELLELLDGTRTGEDIQAEFTRRRPRSRLEVPEALKQFDDASVLVDGAAVTTLNSYEQERWKRNLGFFETYASLDRSKYSMQERLRDFKVGLLGLGGVGSHVSLDLLGLGITDLRVVDFDEVELSNLNRQILYSESDIGQRKVPTALRRLREYFPQADIEGVELRLSSVADVKNVVADRDLVICAVDRPKVHVNTWINQACVEAGVPFTAGGVETQRSFLYLIIPGVTGCIECWRRCVPTDETDDVLQEELDARHADNPGIGPDMAAFGPMVTVLTSIIVTELVRYVTGIAPPIAAGRLMEMRFDDLVIREGERWERQDDCPVCGRAEPSP